MVLFQFFFTAGQGRSRLAVKRGKTDVAYPFAGLSYRRRMEHVRT